MRTSRTGTGVRVAAWTGVALLGCASASTTGTDAATGSSSVPAIFDRFAADVEISVEGDVVVLRSDGVPDHGSPYFGSGDSRYEAYDGSNAAFQLNPNRISEQQFTFRIPLDPVVATSPSATPLGPIGISVNGVALFNQYAGPNRPLTFEVDSFDQYNGHPQQTGVYHYHVEPLHITETRGADALIGVLLDGFPVYGPEEDGATVTNAELDELHGHFGVTADFPEGIYHYHVTSQDPYINGAGFRGDPGTVSG